MPVRNKPGFVPKSARHQPLFYVELFGRVKAVYTHPHTGATIYLSVDADIWNHNSIFDAYGSLQIQYQAESRVILSCHKTLREALSKMDAVLENKSFGERLKYKPVARDLDEDFPRRWPNKNLFQPIQRFRRKGNGKRFVLTNGQKSKLLANGALEKDLPFIEEAANKATFVLDDETPINAHEALAILGENTFLSGMDRSTFHWTCVRETPDGKHTVFFDTQTFHRQK